MTTVLILAGGLGTRLGADIPKQYIEIKGKPIISYCIDVFKKHKQVDGIQIVADEAWRKYILRFVPTDKFKGFSLSGKNRQLSIYNGLCDIRKYSAENDIVVIHDAARPLVSEKVITECIETAKEYDGALPVLPMKDTVYVSEDKKRVTALLKRSEMFAGQAPEAFKLGKYYRANVALLPYEILNINGSSEPAVIAKMDIAMIEGDENNFKITTQNDLEKFMRMVEMSKL